VSTTNYCSVVLVLTAPPDQTGRHLLADYSLSDGRPDDDDDNNDDDNDDVPCPSVLTFFPNFPL